MWVRSRRIGVFVVLGACSGVACSAIVGIHDATEFPPDGGSDDGSTSPEVGGGDARLDGSSTPDTTADVTESGVQGHDATVDGREPDARGVDVTSDVLDSSSDDVMAANDGAEGPGDAPDGGAVDLDAVADVVDASSNVHDSATEATLDGAPGARDASVDAYDGATCGGPLPDESVGVFVDVTRGADLLGCGAQQSPCLTIKTAISSAQAASKGTVYVAAGSYFGPVALAAGIRIQGGWTSQWTPVCTLPYSVVTITGTSSGPATVSAVNLGGTATLDTLTVLSKPSTEVDAGETTYGILAEGSTTSLVLKDVVVQTASGGAGTAGAVGSVGVLPVTPDGGCASATGAIGATGAAGSPPGTGSFAASGYSWTTGGQGSAGTPGGDGVVGAMGTCAAVNCYCIDATQGFPKTVTCSPVPCGGVGGSGCGGGGGGGGTPGGGGGSSVGVFISGATVSGTGGLIQAGNGGAGGPGGAGGAGSVGSGGMPGSSGICDTSCTTGQSSTICIPDNPVTLAGGSAGGTGGTGGTGGPGAGGAGGSSCAYVVVGGSDAGVVWVGTRFVEGQAGTGGSPNGLAGVAKDQCP